MSRIIKGSLGLLAATAATGSLVLASPGIAQAATYGTGYSDSERNVTNGTGDADASSNANDSGRLVVATKANGGDAAGPLGESTPSTGRATASLGKRVAAANGTYRVVVRYEGLAGSERDRGSDSNANVKRTSFVRFVSQTGDDNRRVQRVQELPGSGANRKTVLFIDVPNNASGFLRIGAELGARSTADGEGSSARANGHVDDVSFKVDRTR